MLNGVWDRAEIVARLHLLLLAGRYDSVLTMLPSLDTHGHHQAATALALEAVNLLPSEIRPVVLTGETASSREPQRRFTEHPDFPETRVEHELPTYAFHRAGYQHVISSAVAEHKTQGLFQAVAGHHDIERFWTFSASAGSLRPAA